MNILVDMDGIICDLLGKWLRVYNEESDDNVTKEDVKTWGTHEHVKIGHDIYSIIERPGFFDDLEPLPGAIDGITELQKSGNWVKIVSSPCNADSARAKIEWCARHLGIEHQDVITMHDKDWLIGAAKVLIDDSPANIAAWNLAGGDAYAIAYPYNAIVAHRCNRYHGYRDTKKAWQDMVADILRNE